VGHAAGDDGARLVSRAGGYLLEVRHGERDIDGWQQALDRARRAREDGELGAAREGVEEALRIWRGEPLGGVSAHGLLAAERARLEEERLAAVTEGIELDLELGRHGELPGPLEALVIAHPFNERLVELHENVLRQAQTLGVEVDPAPPGADGGRRALPAVPNRTIGRAGRRRPRAELRGRDRLRPRELLR
jgi:DNA-binding SARP family transcriptional activator